MTATSPLAYVTDGREAIGFILRRGPHRHEAFDRDEQSLGSFSTAAAAANAVCARAKNGEGAG
jgi:hypothetical protein